VTPLAAYTFSAIPTMARLLTDSTISPLEPGSHSMSLKY
jgi:hypothetical protein